MPRLTTPAICLRHWEFSETSQTALLLTESLGLVRCLAKGSRRDDPRFSGGLEITDLAEADLILPDSGAMATLAGWDLTELFPHARESLAIFHRAMYAIDLISATLAERDPHPRAFGALVHLLREQTPSAPGALVRFQWNLLDEIGYRPRLMPVPPQQVMRFSPSAGGIAHEDDRSPGWRVRSGTIALLLSLESDEPIEAPSEDAERACALLGAYLREIAGRELAGAEQAIPLNMPPPRDP